MKATLYSEIQITIVDESVRTLLPPVVDRYFKTKKVVLIHTDEYLQEANDLSKSYQSFQIHSIFEKMSSSLNILELEGELKLIFNKYKSLSPIVNVSNGSKLHSIALYNIAKQLELPVFCVNYNDTISWLWPEVTDNIEIEDRIKIPTFLEANGFSFIRDSQPYENQSLKMLLTWMVSNIVDLKHAVSQLNYYAYSAGKVGISKPLQGNLDQLRVLVHKFSQAGFAEIKNNRIHFLNEEVRFFANGGWLEEFIHFQIAELKNEIPEIHDFRSGIEVSSIQHNVKNEIDNMALVNNQLFLIECKTKKFTDRGHPEGGAMDAIYKMDTLMSEIGGPVAKGMMVSIYPFSSAETDRAKQYDIELVSFEEIKNIKQRLKAWFLS